MKRQYIVTWLVCFGSMTIHENSFITTAYCKYHAWLKWKKAHLNDSNHYACIEYLNSYWHMRKDIERVGYLH